MGKAFGNDVALGLLLQAVVADAGCRLERLLHIAALQNLA